MSQAPTNLPKRTRVLVKDFIFQEKYNLTDTQVDVMAYIINALNWAITIGGFMPLTTKKVTTDLPKISAKTLESSLRELKIMGLIETELIKVEKWGNAKVRGVKITEKGMNYNSSFFTPSEKKIIENLQTQLAEQKAKNSQLESKLIELKLTKTPNIEEEEPTIEIEPVEEPTIEIEPIEETRELETPPKEEFPEFIERVKREFITTSQPICNCVDGWAKETTFYTNSYNRLALISPTGDYLQLKNPVEINKFWSWLYTHQDRIGEVYDFSKKLDADELNNRYKNTILEVRDKRCTILEFIPVDNVESEVLVPNNTRLKPSLPNKSRGVKIKAKKHKTGEIFIFSNAEDEHIVYKPEDIEDIVLMTRI